MAVEGAALKLPRFIRFGDIRWNNEKRRHFCRRFLPFYITACVWSLLSVATFGCIFSIVKNLRDFAFTQFIFQTRFA